MLSYLPKYCTDCSELRNIIVILDKKIAKMIKNNWDNRRFLVNKSFCKRTYKDLLYYRQVAEHLMSNADYLGSDIDYTQFLSKVKIFTK